ncbi:nucleotide exchange factor GrpE [Micromonospora sp. NPDC050397]|uniref:nucleotide exchange factor GrpE n=1 Tax=Micromonospora sp. NPDC050397 TaxID=3364279 RepID=UPI00384C795B
MTEKPQAADPETTGAAPGGSGPDGVQAGERVVIRDNRKITRPDGDPAGAAAESDAAVKSDAVESDADEPVDAGKSTAEAEPGDPDDAEPAGESDRSDTPILDELVEEAEVEVELADGKARGPKLDQPAGPEGAVVDAPAKPVSGAPGEVGTFGAELEALRADLDERTKDLQRVSAEYANYRKRVDRDRGVAAEQTMGSVLTALLPVLDDLDRAREHGDLVGPFGSVAEQLNAVLTRFGLTAFGEKGDPFDPTRHEAVAHQTSAEVTEPTCVEVMRRGYQLGERLLRPALVAVADPE